jgi:transposase
MDADTIHWGRREQRRAWVLNHLLARALTVSEAATLLGITERQVRRVRERYQAAGPAGLVHGNRGRRPWQAVGAEVREQVVALARGPYAGLNQQHLSEKLAEAGLGLHRTTVRRILLAAGLASPRTRRAPRHRRRRERMPREGLLLQADGSRHRWFGPDGPYLTLVGAIDDATGTVPGALFREQEDAAGYLALLGLIAQAKGLPVALYIDRHGIFKRSTRDALTLEEELAGGRLPTQVGRALEELGIRSIFALSPQAKGRIERLWGTLQDRLVAELRLAQITTLAAANAFLPDFLAGFNTRFGVPPVEPEPAYRAVPTELVLDRVLCFKYVRQVQADNTVTFGGQALQLQPGPGRTSWARVQVEVHEHLDGSLAVCYQGEAIASRPAPPDTPTLRARQLPRPGRPEPPPPVATPESAPPPYRPHTSPLSHPFKRFPRDRRRPAEPGS